MSAKFDELKWNVAQRWFDNKGRRGYYVALEVRREGQSAWDYVPLDKVFETHDDAFGFVRSLVATIRGDL